MECTVMEEKPMKYKYVTHKHLVSNRIDLIALQLDNDVYGASGDWSEAQIRKRLMKSIAEQHGNDEWTLAQVADLVFGVWQHKDRDLMEMLTDPPDRPLPDTLEEWSEWRRKTL
jgi:hypothetical protein